MDNRRVRVMWSDLNGLAHGRYVPDRRSSLPGHHAVTSLTMSIDGDILPIEGYAADVGFPDLTAMPVPETRRTGWETETDVLIADLTYHGEPLPISPRVALKKAVEAWHSLGYEPQIAYELEFYIAAPDPAAPAGFTAVTQPGHRVYGVGPGCDGTGVLFDVFDAAERCNLGLEGMSGEFHPGQLELNLHYGPALDSADRAFMAKEMTRELAAIRGYKVTYMGRPFAHYVGSGLHVNFSIVPLAGGANAFDDPQAEHGLSSLARQSLGGLIRHHEGLAALSAPLVNSYKRLVPGIIAGYWANWGLDNRFSTYRVPHERGPKTRIENRMVCASADPYLAAAAMLNAALIGVAEGLDCGDPQVGDADTAPNTDRHTPHTLEEALDAFEADSVLCDSFGPDLVRTFLILRRDELDKWKATGEPWDPESISDWELQRYLPFY